jgi:hypothetical protein
MGGAGRHSGNVHALFHHESMRFVGPGMGAAMRAAPGGRSAEWFVGKAGDGAARRSARKCLLRAQIYVKRKFAAMEI